jgi:hypothetical protein
MMLGGLSAACTNSALVPTSGPVDSLHDVAVPRGYLSLSPRLVREDNYRINSSITGSSSPTFVCAQPIAQAKST